MSTTRVPGHTLIAEGAPWVLNANQRPIRVNSSFYAGVGGFGRGMCSCGALSEPLTSGYQRKAWHREHKAEAAER